MTAAKEHGSEMRRVLDFRENAEACRKLAAHMPPQQRQQLLDMAAEWDRIAEERERVLASSETVKPIKR
jgi:hypothetical protein